MDDLETYCMPPPTTTVRMQTSTREALEALERQFADQVTQDIDELGAW